MSQFEDNYKTSATAVQRIPIEQISAGAHQARRRFDEAALVELAASIAESGVVQPVVVCGDAQRGYRLLAGERRWRAAQRAGLDHLPALVRNDLDDAEAAVLGLIENLQRESLGVMDTANGLAELARTHALTHDALAQRIGKSRVYVTHYLRLRQLHEEIQQLLDNNQLSLGHAKILAGLAKPEQLPLARRAVAKGLNVRQLEALARRSQAPSAAVGGQQSSDRHAMQAIESRLSEHVGNAVRIDFDAARRRGELRITFHDLDEFDGLLARLGFDPNR